MFSEKMLAEMPVSFSPPAIANLLGVSKSYIYKLISMGELPHYEVGARKIVLRDDFLQWFYSKKRG